MANITKSIADTAGVIADIFSQKALKVLRANIVLAKIVARDTDFTDEFQKGDDLKIPYAGTFVANDKAADTVVTLQVPSGNATTTVTLSKHKETSFLLEDIAQAEANPDSLDTFAESATIAIVEQIESDLFAEYTNKDSTVGVNATPLTAATMRAAAQNLDNNKVPMSNRHFIMTPGDMWAIMADSNLAAYFANADPETIRQGALAKIYGFTTWKSQLVKNAAGGNHNLAIRNDAILLAMRKIKLPPAPQGNVVATHVKDPDSGLILRVLIAYRPDYLSTQVTVDALYGIKTIRSKKMIEVLS